jgi:hypothetical protein
MVYQEAMKIAVFLGDFFWSSIPYDGLRLFDILSNTADVDLLMFEKDIRLNKKFTGQEKFKFKVESFKKIKNLRTLSSWGDFINASKDYKLIITSSHIAPKTRYPSIRGKTHCPIAVWDIGGGDILTNAVHFADYFFVKSFIWKKWLEEKNIDKNKIFVTGTPHYDPYCISDYKDRISFFEKYSIPSENKVILICPSNPVSRKQMFDQNIKELERLVTISEQSKISLLIKTYPGDYLHNEAEFQYSGVYTRKADPKQPQYETLKQSFPSVVIVESQDHFSAIMNCDALFNISGSHISWETHFCKAKSYSMNYNDKKFYKTVSYLENVLYPDEIYNTHMNCVDEILNMEFSYKDDNEYIMRTDSAKNIANIINSVIAKSFT